MGVADLVGNIAQGRDWLQPPRLLGLIRVALSSCPELERRRRVTIRWSSQSHGISFAKTKILIVETHVSRIVLNRNALLTTDTELRLIAAAAIIGLRSR